ncbi:MAG: 6-phosphofructokinase [Chloroherpetonaceae bacterium]|nr:6-phosphofructokinase [Chloroherpetonaceae bacterium]
MPKEVSFSAESHETLTLLKSLPIFKRFSDTDLLSIGKLMLRFEYAEGEYVFHEGETGKELFIVESGKLAHERHHHTIFFYTEREVFGEESMFQGRHHQYSVKAVQPTTIYSISSDALTNGQGLPLEVYANFYREVCDFMTVRSHEEEMIYREMDVLLVQDGGCAPGYNPVTAFLTEFLEQAGRRVFIAKEGFKSLVSGQQDDYRYLVYSMGLYKQLERIPGVIFSPPLREARGADFRTERYGDFKHDENIRKAAENLIQRKVKVLIGIGGNGTFKGIDRLSQLLPETVQTFFIPVTIDSDIIGTECIGQHTGVEVGAEKIRCYMADARTHHRCYIIELMGAAGGYHALHSCLGAGAHLAVLPQSNYDPVKLSQALKNRTSTVIVVAEGYKADERKSKGYQGNAAEYFRDQLLAAGLQTRQRVICEPFSRDVRGARPNNNDITLAQRMVCKLTELIKDKHNRMMPAVLSGRDYAIPFYEIRTENSVESNLAELANRLGV